MMLRKVLIGVWVLWSGAAMAEEVRIDGCAELARIVYDEVQSSVLRGVSGAGPWYINPQQGDIHVCRTAAKTVSQAFTLAVQSAGIDFRWAGRRDRGDYCLSGFLSQCYPDTGGLPDAQRYPRSVGPIWLKVSQTVMNEMYNPFSSDEVRFRADDLRLRMGLSLRTVEHDRERLAIPGSRGIQRH